MTRKCFTLLLTMVLFFFTKNIISQTIAIQGKPGGYLTGAQITFDIYRPYLSIYGNFRKNTKPNIIKQGDESKIYSYLGKQILSPKFVLLQTTFYQLSALSSYLETDEQNHFNRFNSVGGINLLSSVGMGNEEPYAFSLFLGNIAFLSYRQKNKQGKMQQSQSGSALAGFGLNFGYHQIFDNIYFPDNWYQPEIILIGNLKENYVRKISWNFRVGAKFHSNKILRDAYSFTIERNHATFKKIGFSLSQNSKLKYKISVPVSFKNSPPFLIYMLFSYGKKFPFKFFNRKMFFVFGAGINWQWGYFYNRTINKFEDTPSKKITWLIQPNIEF